MSQLIVERLKQEIFTSFFTLPLALPESTESVNTAPLSSTLHWPAAAVVRGGWWWGGGGRGSGTLHIISIINFPSPTLNEANQSQSPKSEG